jgi:transcriptional regulator GlxA family with amidase domain
LDGRRTATHWLWAKSFHRLHPRVLLEPDVLFVDDGDVLTAAGSAAALDLGLHIWRRDRERRIKPAGVRRAPGRRSASVRGAAGSGVPNESLAPLLAWAPERLGEPLTVTDLAARAAVSSATLHRRFRAQLGTTPLAWLTAERVTLARRLIERADERLDVVAGHSGLGTAAKRRARLRRETGLSLSAYRPRPGASGGEAVSA